MPETEIWITDPCLTNMEDVLLDASNVLGSTGLDWFKSVSDKEAALEIITKKEEVMKGTWGMGNFRSAIRLLYSAFLAKDLGLQVDAEKYFERLKRVNSKFEEPWDMQMLEREFQTKAL